MAMARGNAALPAAGKRFVGAPHGPADETDGACADLPPPGAPRRAARLYQKNAQDAGAGFGLGAQAPEGVKTMSKKGKQRKNHMGSSIDDFLKEEGIFEEAQAQAVKEVVAWQLDVAMRKRKKTQKQKAKPLQNHRTPHHHTPSPKNH